MIENFGDIVIEIFAGTIHILLFYLAMAILVFVLLRFTKPTDAIFIRLNSIGVNRTHKTFRLNYVVIIGAIIIILISLILISIKDFRNGPTNFQIFGFFSFIALPICIGILPIYSNILRNGGYKLGNAILFMVAGIMFAMYGINLHDVIWCGITTNWFTVEVIGGYDLELFFSMFRITDPNQWSYRTFGVYMILKSLVELEIATLLFFKLYKISSSETPATENRENDKEDAQKYKKRFKRIYWLLFATSTIFGIIVFAFDFPWAFTNLEYYVILYFGIIGVSLLFAFSCVNLNIGK